MEEKIKMKIKNADGIEIIKDVPVELYSNYIAIGWEVVDQKKETAKQSFSSKPKAEKNISEDKENENI